MTEFKDKVCLDYAGQFGKFKADAMSARRALLFPRVRRIPRADFLLGGEHLPGLTLMLEGDAEVTKNSDGP
jgi:hypothetical protein